MLEGYEHRFLVSTAHVAASLAQQQGGKHGDGASSRSRCELPTWPPAWRRSRSRRGRRDVWGGRREGLDCAPRAGGQRLEGAGRGRQSGGEGKLSSSKDCRPRRLEAHLPPPPCSPAPVLRGRCCALLLLLLRWLLRLLRRVRWLRTAPEACGWACTGRGAATFSLWRRPWALMGTQSAGTWEGAGPPASVPPPTRS